MAYTDWLIKGPKISSCNCDYGCPCEFNAPPTYDICEGLEAHLIEEGYFGEIRLDGLVVVARYRWPGPVHEGHGIVQGIIDERATAAQREALGKILDGEEQEPNTAFNIYASTFDDVLVAALGIRKPRAGASEPGRKSSRGRSSRRRGTAERKVARGRRDDDG